MIKLHELQGDPGKRQKPKRVGRGEGSGLGKTSGRGSKGQLSRSGGGKGPYFEGGQMPLIRRLPKFGFDNTRFRAVRATVTLDQLNKFEDGATVDKEALNKAGIVPKKVERIKVVATGSLSRKLTVKLSGYSAKAREAIESAGGACETV